MVQCTLRNAHRKQLIHAEPFYNKKGFRGCTVGSEDSFSAHVTGWGCTILLSSSTLDPTYLLCSQMPQVALFGLIKKVPVVCPHGDRLQRIYVLTLWFGSCQQTKSERMGKRFGQKVWALLIRFVR